MQKASNDGVVLILDCVELQLTSAETSRMDLIL